MATKETKKKVKREPLFITEIYTGVSDTEIVIKATIYKPFEDKIDKKTGKLVVKKHKRVGFGKLVFTNIGELSITIFLDVVENRYWIAFPRQKGFDVFLLPRASKDILNQALNDYCFGKEKTEESIPNDIPWDLDL